MLRAAPLLLLAIPLAAVAAPIPYTPEEARLRAVYGTPSDPDEKLAFRLDGTRLRVRLPARTPHPTSDPGPRPGLCVWKEVTGDFEATVRVSSPAEAKTSGALGLVAWAREDDYLGLARTTPWPPRAPGATWENGVCLRYRHPTDVWTTTQRLSTPGPDLYLRLIRTGPRVTAGRSPDGLTWYEFAPVGAYWPPTVRVGVYAANRSGAAVEAVFEEYTLTQSKK